MQSSIDSLWMLLAASLVFLMQAGFLCLETGLVQRKNAPVTAMKNLIDWTIVGLAFFAFGFGVVFGDDVAGLVGWGLFALEGLSARDFPGGHYFYLFQLGFCATAVTIVSGALAERVSFHSYLAASCLMALLIYPFYGHWVWGEAGWLAHLGFVDFAGSLVVHGTGGMVALVGTYMVGARLGRFDADGTPHELEAASPSLSVLGVVLLWLGWWGFNGGSALAFDDSVGTILVNTNVAASAGALCGFLHARFAQKGRAVLPKIFGGLLGGLVAVTASAHLLTPLGAMSLGATAGWVHNVAYEALLRWRIDDPVGAVPVHLACGVLGGVGVAIFAPGDSLAHGRIEQLAIQCVGVFVCLGWAGGGAYLLFVLLRRTLGLRVSPEEERSGLSFAEFVPQPPDLDEQAELQALLQAHRPRS